MLSFLSVVGDLVEGLPLVVDSFACLLAMDAHAKLLPASKITDANTEGYHLESAIKEEHHQILEAAITLFRSSLLSAKKLPGNPRHLLGPMGSLLLWLDRIKLVDPNAS